MRMQTEMIQVKNDPKIINEVNSKAAIWGWSVLNIQITDQKIVKEGNSQGRESFFGDEYVITKEVITEHINYASITYQRDLDDPRVAKLADMEKDYNNCDRLDYLGEDQTFVLEECKKTEAEKNKFSLYAKLCFFAAIAIIILALITGSAIFDYLFFILFAASCILKIKTFVTRDYRIADKKIAELNAHTLKERAKAKQRIMQAALDLK